jgi:hypothetical protein
LWEAAFKRDGTINLAEEISGQSSTQVVARLFLAIFFNQSYSENKKPKYSAERHKKLEV